jgi:hypothetical protein
VQTGRLFAAGGPTAVSNNISNLRRWPHRGPTDAPPQWGRLFPCDSAGLTYYFAGWPHCCATRVHRTRVRARTRARIGTSTKQWGTPLVFDLLEASIYRETLNKSGGPGVAPPVGPPVSCIQQYQALTRRLVAPPHRGHRGHLQGDRVIDQCDHPTTVRYGTPAVRYDTPLNRGCRFLLTTAAPVCIDGCTAGNGAADDGGPGVLDE